MRHFNVDAIFRHYIMKDFILDGNELNRENEEQKLSEQIYDTNKRWDIYADIKLALRNAWQAKWKTIERLCMITADPFHFIRCFSFRHLRNDLLRKWKIIKRGTVAIAVCFHNDVFIMASAPTVSHMFILEAENLTIYCYLEWRTNCRSSQHEDVMLFTGPRQWIYGCRPFRFTKVSREAKGKNIDVVFGDYLFYLLSLFLTCSNQRKVFPRGKCQFEQYG